MSTLGKVLVILITLATVGWIFLASLVAEHHANWGKLINDTKAEIAQIEPLLPPLQDQIDRKNAETSLLQVSLDRSRRNFRGEYAMAQRDQSETRETLSRYTLQDALVKSEVVKAQARAEVRAQEKADFERKIAAEKSNVETLQKETGELRNRYETMIKDFLATRAENQSMLERLKKAGTSSSRPSARFGSYVR